jgi:hypothetical protein
MLFHVFITTITSPLNLHNHTTFLILESSISAAVCSFIILSLHPLLLPLQWWEMGDVDASPEPSA